MDKKGIQVNFFLTIDHTVNFPIWDFPPFSNIIPSNVIFRISAGNIEENIPRKPFSINFLLYIWKILAPQFQTV